MQIERFKWSEHLFLFKEWLKSYSLDEKLADELPGLGMVAIEDSIIYCMGFIRSIESCSYGMMDGLIANPSIIGKKRSAALDQLVFALKEQAKKIGLKRLIAQTDQSAILKRCIRHGFSKVPHTVIVVDI